MPERTKALALLPPARASTELVASPPAAAPERSSWQHQFAGVFVPVAGEAAGRAAISGLIPPRPAHGKLDGIAEQAVAAAASVAACPAAPPEVRLAAAREARLSVQEVAAAHERREQRRDAAKRKLFSGAVWSTIAAGLGTVLWRAYRW